MFRSVRARVREAGYESGQGLFEYTFLIALIAVVCIATVASIGQTLTGLPGWLLFG